MVKNKKLLSSIIKDPLRFRNIGVIAHIDAGKTTTVERFLKCANMIHKQGDVHEKNTTTDFMEQERARGITIKSKTIEFEWQDNVFHLIDTPGHQDFQIEVERSLRVLDGAVVIIDGAAGVEPQTLGVWRQAKRYNVSCIFVVNKLDKLNTSFSNKGVGSIMEKLTEKLLILHVPIIENQRLHGIYEILTNNVIIWPNDDDPILYEITDLEDDRIKPYLNQNFEEDKSLYSELYEIFLKENNLTHKSPEVKKLIREKVIKNELFPVYAASALKNKGIPLILDGVSDYLPTPIDKNTVPIDQDFLGLAFKISNDIYFGVITFTRIYSGSIKIGDSVKNFRTKKVEKIKSIIKYWSDKRININEAYAGDIVVLLLEDTLTGDTLHSPNLNVQEPLSNIEIPESVVQISIKPKTQADQKNMTTALKNVQREDPTIKVKFDHETQQWLILGLGELHLEIVVQKLSQEFNVKLETSKPSISNREAITKEVDYLEYHKKQTGGAGQYAKMKFRIYPNKDGFEFIDTTKGGVIPKEWMKEIRSGMLEATKEGPITKSQVINVGIELYDGDHHSVDSSSRIFSMAAFNGVKEAIKLADPKRLTPISEITIITPIDFTGKVIRNLAENDAIISDNKVQGDESIIVALMKMEKIFNYGSTLLSITKGFGSYVYKFSHYE